MFFEVVYKNFPQFGPIRTPDTPVEAANQGINKTCHGKSHYIAI